MANKMTAEKRQAEINLKRHKERYEPLEYPSSQEVLDKALLDIYSHEEDEKEQAVDLIRKHLVFSRKMFFAKNQIWSLFLKESIILSEFLTHLGVRFGSQDCIRPEQRIALYWAGDVSEPQEFSGTRQGKIVSKVYSDRVIEASERNLDKILLANKTEMARYHEKIAFAFVLGCFLTALCFIIA